MEQIIRYTRRVICFPIKLYQWMLSPYINSCCRFYPSCSQYALLAITHYGVFKGIGLTCWRLLRCQPWAKGGYDPILPDKEKP